jgi:hypothetical protein
MKRVRFAMGAALLLLVQVAIPQATAAADATYLGPGTVRVDESKSGLKFRDFHVSVINGKHAAGGVCAVRTPKLTIHPGEAPLGVREVSANAASCRVAVKIGHLASRPAAPRGGRYASSGTPAPVAAAAGGSEHCYQTTWRDPIHIEVNHVQDCVYYGWDDWGNVNYCSGTDSRWWLSDDGWQENYNDVWSDSGSNYCHGSTHDEFSNGWFHLFNCSGDPPSGTTYNRNEVWGWNDATGSGYPGTWAWGGCANLLWYETSLW